MSLELDGGKHVLAMTGEGPRREPCGPDWQRRRGQTHQAAGAGSWSGRAALAVLPSWSVR